MLGTDGVPGESHTRAHTPCWAVPGPCFVRLITLSLCPLAARSVPLLRAKQSRVPGLVLGDAATLTEPALRPRAALWRLRQAVGTAGAGDSSRLEKLQFMLNLSSGRYTLSLFYLYNRGRCQL